MRPFHRDIDGIVEYAVYNGRLKIGYTLNCKSEYSDGIYKLLLMSSVKPFNPPVIVHTPEFKGSVAWGERIIDESTLALSGYYAHEVDTFALVHKDSHITASAGFDRLTWDISSSVTSDNDRDRTLIRAEAVIKSDIQISNPDAYKETLKELNSFKKTLSVMECGPIDSYEWYSMADDSFPRISSFNHLLAPLKKFGKCMREVIVGFTGSLDIAFAVAMRDNPFENSEDCSIYENGYWISAVRLAPEGQYFLRPDVADINNNNPCTDVP